MANLIEYIQGQIYENSTEDITGSIMQQVLTRMVSDEGVINVHTVSGQSPFAVYSNAQAARDAVPAGFKKLGLVITYKLAGGWFVDEYIGTATSGWSTASNWKCLGPISVSQNAQTGKTTITIGSESFDVATQPVSVSQNIETGKTELLIGNTPALIVDNEPELESDNAVKSGGVVSILNGFRKSSHLPANSHNRTIFLKEYNYGNKVAVKIISNTATLVSGSKIKCGFRVDGESTYKDLYTDRYITFESESTIDRLYIYVAGDVDSAGDVTVEIIFGKLYNNVIIDDQPIENSTHFVQSGGIYTYVNSAIQDAISQISYLANERPGVGLLSIGSSQNEIADNTHLLIEKNLIVSESNQTIYNKEIKLGNLVAVRLLSNTSDGSIHIQLKKQDNTNVSSQILSSFIRLDAGDSTFKKAYIYSSGAVAVAGTVQIEFLYGDAAITAIIDTVVTNNSKNLVTSGAVHSAIDSAKTEVNNATDTKFTNLEKKENQPDDYLIVGDINNSGKETSTQKRVHNNKLIKKPFKVTLASGYRFTYLVCYDYDYTNQQYVYNSRQSKSGDTLSVDSMAFAAYRFVISKTDQNALIDITEYPYIISNYKDIIDLLSDKTSENTTAIQNIQVNLYSTYDFVKKVEEERVNKTFLPYAIGTISTGATFGWEGKGYDRLNLVFMTDSHTDYNYPEASLENFKDTIDFANNSKAKIAAVIEGGDVLTYTDSTLTAFKEKLNAIFGYAKLSELPFIYCKGNHDMNDYNKTPDKQMTDADWSEVWLNYAETNYGIVRQTKANGQKSTWHYLDLPDYKVRIVCVDICDADHTITDGNGKVLYEGARGFYVSNEQMNWLASTALNFDDKDEKDWGVIIVQHWYDPTEQEATTASPAFDSIQPALNSLYVAFKNQSSVNISVNSDFEYSSFAVSCNADFTRYAELDAKPYFICVLYGHSHQDANRTDNGIVAIRTASGHCGFGASDTRINRIPATNTQNLFDIVSIDLRTKKIRYFRYGAGVTCYGLGGDRFLPDGLSY